MKNILYLIKNKKALLYGLASSIAYLAVYLMSIGNILIQNMQYVFNLKILENWYLLMFKFWGCF